MSESSYRDRTVDEVTAKVIQRQGVDTDESVVREKAEQAVDALVEAPMQTFTPLLAENAVLSELHATGRDRGAEDAHTSPDDKLPADGGRQQGI